MGADFLAVRVKHACTHRFRVALAQFEDMADLDCFRHFQNIFKIRCDTAGQASPSDHVANICLPASM